MAIFILTIEKIIGLTQPIKISESTNAIFIIWQEDIDQSIQIQLSVSLAAGNQITINHCIKNTDNIFSTETIDINPNINQQVLNFTKNKLEIASYLNPLTEKYFTSQIESMNNNAPITAEKIMSVIENTNESNVFVYEDGGKLYFQSNKQEFIMGVQYTDFLPSWDFNVATKFTGSINSTAANTSTTINPYNYLLPEFEQLNVIAEPKTDVILGSVSFGAVRTIEYWTANTNLYANTYQGQFAMNIDTSNLDDNFINVRFSNCIVAAASPSFINSTFGGTFFGTTAQATSKKQTSCFRVKFNDVPIIAVPLTTNSVQSAATQQVLKMDFFVSDSYFLFCEKFEIPKMHNYISSDNVNLWGNGNIDLAFGETMRNGEIYNVYITQNSPNLQTLPTTQNINIGEEIVSEEYALKTVFTLRIIVNLGVTARLNINYNGQTTELNVNTDLFFVTDVICSYKKNKNEPWRLALSIPKKLSNITYYDWVYKPNVADKNALMRLSTSLNPLTTAQYAQFANNNPIRVTQSLNAGDTFIIENIKCYYLRGEYVYYTSSSQTTIAYSTAQYKDNCVFNINIANIEDAPTLLIVKNLSFLNVCPVGNNKMFPLSTTSTTNRPYKNYEEPLFIKINNQIIFQARNTSSAVTDSFKEKTISFKRYILSIGGEIYAVAAPVFPNVQYKYTNINSTTTNLRLENDVTFLIKNSSFYTYNAVFLKNTDCTCTLLFCFAKSTDVGLYWETFVNLKKDFTIRIGGNVTSDTASLASATLDITSDMTTYDSARFKVTQTANVVEQRYNVNEFYLEVVITSSFVANKWTVDIKKNIKPW